jgi:hypothetical protein
MTMLELRHYIDRSLVGFILMGVVVLTVLLVLVPIISDVVEAARALSLDISVSK